MNDVDFGLELNRTDRIKGEEWVSSSPNRLVLIASAPTEVNPLIEVLVRAGYEVQRIAESDVSQLTETHFPHLVLVQSTHQYPWTRIYQSLKSNPRTQHLPLVVLTDSSIDLETVQQFAKEEVMFLSSSTAVDLVSSIEVQLDRMRLKAKLREGSGNLLPCPECQLWNTPQRCSTDQLSLDLPLKEVQRIAHLGSWEWRSHSPYIRGSRETYRILGIKPQQMTYRQVLKMVDPEDRREFHHRVQTAILTVIPQDVEMAFYSGERQHGQLRYCQLRVQPILGTTGEVIGLFGILLDVSDRQILEQKIQTSEMEMRSVFAAMADIVLALDAAAETIKIIPTTPALGDGVELISETIDQMIYGDQREVVFEKLQEVITHKSTVIFDYSLVLGEQKLWFSTTLSPMGEDQVIWLARDVTPAKQAELERDIALQQAQAANQAKSQFLANMSHELRTPLNAILGFTQVLLRNPYFNSEDRSSLEVIYHSGEHLLGLINNILDLSKVESGYIYLNPKMIEMEVFLQTLYQMLALKAQAKGIDFQMQRQTSLPRWLTTDEGKLRQILINLLGNAIKFTDTGEVILRVSYHQQAKPTPLLEIEVEDTGPGISADEMPLIFQPFQQASAGLKSQEGTGLGLSISHKFVALLGGELTVSSVVNQGTVFGFRIPVQVDKRSECQQSDRYHRVQGLVADCPESRILVVEERWADRQWLVKLLQDVGFVVQSAANGPEAIAQWQQHSPHLILIHLPPSNQQSVDIIKQIRQTPEGQHLPIIAMSAIAFDQDLEAISTINCDSFLRKPLQDSVLFATLAEYLPIEYRYREELQQTEFSSFIEPEAIDTTALSMMSVEWLEQLYHATVTLDDQTVLDLLDDLPAETTELTHFIQQKLHHFDFEEILQIITPFLPENWRCSLEWEE